MAILLSTLDLGTVTGAVTADWSLDRDDTVNAFINLTYYVQEAKKVHTEKSEVSISHLNSMQQICSDRVSFITCMGKKSKFDGRMG